jgi:membrane-bound lytic murein transglycosylase D
MVTNNFKPHALLRRVGWMGSVIIGIVAAIFLFEYFVHSAKPASASEAGVNKDYTVFPFALPEQLSFAGEVVPLQDLDVRERLDREFLVNTYFHSQTLLFIKKANRFLPVIEPILAKYNIPDDFKYLPLAESGLGNAVSPKNAVGFWQFREETAKHYGLEINKEVDERYHVEKSTEAACKYLLESYAIYKNWTLAAASYNMGRAGLNRQLKRQMANNYYDLLLGEETSRYIFRVLAIKTILEHPDAYGFSLKDEDLYNPVKVKELMVDSAIMNLAAFSHVQGINYKILKLFNPWLRDISLTNLKHKTYYIKVPESGYFDFHRELELQYDTLSEDKNTDILP